MSITTIQRTVNSGDRLTLNLSTFENTAIGGVVDHCGNGTLTGNRYVTDPITGSCDIYVNFVSEGTSPPLRWTVSTQVSVGGSITPTSREVEDGEQTFFDISANPGYVINDVTGCGNGTLTGNRYVTRPVTGHCAVSVTFREEGGTQPAINLPGTLTPFTTNNANINNTHTHKVIFYQTDIITTGRVLQPSASRAILIRANNIAISLPGSPSEGDRVLFVTNVPGSVVHPNITIHRNGKKILQQDENLILDLNNTSLELIFVNNTIGWAYTDSQFN